jgi:hypothetical protein
MASTFIVPATFKVEAPLQLSGIEFAPFISPRDVQLTVPPTSKVEAPLQLSGIEFAPFISPRDVAFTVPPTLKVEAPLQLSGIELRPFISPRDVQLTVPPTLKTLSRVQFKTTVFGEAPIETDETSIAVEPSNSPFSAFAYSGSRIVRDIF